MAIGDPRDGLGPAEVIGYELARIATALETLLLMLVPEPTPDPEAGCPHPEESRVTFGGEEWECTKCRTRFPS